MVRIILPLLAFLTLMTNTHAKTSKDLSVNLVDSLATAMVMQDIQDGRIALRDDQNFFDQIKDFIQESKEFIMMTYDYNGNGRIDFGPELEAVIEFAETIIVALVDTNYNGVIEIEEVTVLIQELLQNVKSQLTGIACQGITKEAEKSGRWLFLRPVLYSLYKQCQNQ
ncbi:MAG: hypothetical protein ACOH5I_20960 [Oligoflexus sp.]